MWRVVGGRGGGNKGGREEKGWSTARRWRVKRVTGSHGEDGEERKKEKKEEKKQAYQRRKGGRGWWDENEIKGGVTEGGRAGRNRGEGREGGRVAEGRKVAGRRKEDRKGRGHCGAGAADVSHLPLAVHMHGATQ